MDGSQTAVAAHVEVAAERLGQAEAHQSSAVRALARPRTTAAILFAVVALVVFVAFASWAPRGFLYFDEPGYAGLIGEADLSRDAIHIGYFLAGIGFTRLVPVDFDFALNLMSALFSAMSIGLVASITYSLTRRVVPSLAAAASLLGAPFFVNFAFDAEIYPTQLFFLLLFTQLFMWSKPIAAGFALAWAFLVSASSILVVPFFLLLRFERRFIARWSGAALALSAGVLLPVYQEYLWGDRGMLKLQPADVNVSNALWKEWAFDIGSRGAPIMALFVVAGIVGLYASPKQRRIAVGLPALWLFPFLLGERYLDVPVQMLLWAMLAVVSGVGVDWLIRRTTNHRWASTIIVALFVVSAAFSAVPQYRECVRQTKETDRFREQLLNIAASAQQGDGVIAIWPSKAIAEYYVMPRKPNLKWIDYEGLSGQSALVDRDAEWRRLDQLIARKRRLWIINTPPIAHVLEPRGYRLARFAGEIYIANPSGR